MKLLEAVRERIDPNYRMQKQEKMFYGEINRMAEHIWAPERDFNLKYGQPFANLAQAFGHRNPKKAYRGRTEKPIETLEELDLTFAQAFTAEIDKQPEESREEWKEQFRSDLYNVIVVARANFLASRKPI